MTLRRAGVVACAAIVVLWFAGCGDYFRPVANPILQPGGDPQRSQHVVAIADNGGNPGSVSTLDISGDTNVGTVSVGRMPMHGAVVGGAVIVANSNDGTVAEYSTLSPQTVPLFVTLQAGADPTFVASTETSTAYIVETGLNRVAAVSIATSSLVADILVGANPVAAVETPDTKKVYAVNRDDNTVTPIATIDKSALPAVAVGDSPVYAVATSDSTLVFVVNQGSNSVSVISTTTDTHAVPDITVGAGPNYAFYDRTLKRVYVTNQAGNSLSIIDASTGTPSLIATIPETGVCTGTAPIAVTAIADGSRVYVANHDSNNVCVLNTTNNTFSRSVTVGTAPVSIQAAADGSKVFVANSLSSSVSDIRTTDDTVVATIPMPQQDPACTNPAPPAAPTCVLQAPVFLVVAP